MKRNLINELIEWKNDKERKPLLLQGARQVGKTYLVQNFGKTEYVNFIYLNFEKNVELRPFFQRNLNPEFIIENLSLYFGQTIDPNNTLLFFDEIQAAPEAITALKYFYEDAPEYHLVAAGSLLGVSVGKQSSFPVGKVNFMTMYPMTFNEYLVAVDQEMIKNQITDLEKLKQIPDVIHEKIIDQFKIYLYLGGMPEVLQSYIDNKDMAKARKIQNEILKAYERDFSKYSGARQAIKTSEFWNSIPYQLAKENKKFKYSDVRKKARASTFELTIEWLTKAGLMNPAYNISVPKIPLGGYANQTAFKVYLHDTGLLGAMLNLTTDNIVSPNKLYEENNGAFIENFVACELSAAGNKPLYYWTSKSDAEVDFVLQIKNDIYPVEVKSGKSKNIKSLRSYADKYKPKKIFRASPRNFTMDKDFVNIPIYAVRLLNDEESLKGMLETIKS